MLAAGAAVAMARCARGGPDVPEPPQFPLGVASGDPTETGALLWTKYVGEAALTARVWEENLDPSTGQELAVRPSDSGFAHVEAEGLSAGRHYRYVFSDGATVSSEGRFRTLPAAGTLARVRLGATCCTRYGVPFDPLARAAERDDLDAFLLLGDTVYCDGAHTLEQYREKWRETLATHEYRALKASTPVIATWDDHEFNNDWSEDTIDRARFTAASTAFFEHLPVRRNALNPDQVWRSVRFGDTLEVFVLDVRSERYRNAGQYIGPEQLNWLLDGLSHSTATFKLVMNSVPLASFSTPFFATTKSDRWEGFTQARSELLTRLESLRPSGVLWVAGDFHLASVGRLDLQGPCCNDWEVLVGPGGQTANASPSYPGRPQFDWSSGTNNFGVFDFDPATGVVTLEYVDGKGRVFHTAKFNLGDGQQQRLLSLASATP